MHGGLCVLPAALPIMLMYVYVYVNAYLCNQENYIPFIVGATEWVLACKSWHVYVVFNHHNVPHIIIRVQPATSIGHN